MKRLIKTKKNQSDKYSQGNHLKSTSNQILLGFSDHTIELIYLCRNLEYTLLSYQYRSMPFLCIITATPSTHFTFQIYLTYTPLLPEINKP